MLLWNHYVVPQWTYGKVRSARWDRFGRPDPLPKYGMSALPDGLVVGRGQGGQGRIALVTGLSRRRLLGVGAGAVACLARRDRDTDIGATAAAEMPSGTACRRSAI